MNYKTCLEEKLREAACFGNLEMLKELISNGVDVNSKNSTNGWTALHWAACRNNVEAVDILLKSGADKKCLTKKGDLPASLSSNEKIIKLLGGDVLNKNVKSLPITPNYLRNPPLICTNTSDITQLQPSIVNSNEIIVNHEEADSLVLKVRIADSMDKDFIEIELLKADSSFEKLKEVCNKELNIELSDILKIRKLPNTIIRNDNDVKRLNNFQELEVVISNPDVKGS